jgi:hypothetical protein
MLLSTARPRTGSCKNPVVGTLIKASDRKTGAFLFLANEIYFNED